MFTSYCLMKSGFYQWIWSLLLAHLLLNTFPAYLWEILERKRLNKLLHECVKIDNMAKFLTDHPNWYTSYEATSFFLCQDLAMSSFVIQVLFMNFYLGNNALCSIFVPLDDFAFQQTCNMSCMQLNLTCKWVRLGEKFTLNLGTHWKNVQPAVSHQHSTSMPPGGPTLKHTHSYIALFNDMMVLMIKRTFLPQYCILGRDS